MTTTNTVSFVSGEEASPSIRRPPFRPTSRLSPGSTFDSDEHAVIPDRHLRPPVQRRDRAGNPMREPRTGPCRPWAGELCRDERVFAPGVRRIAHGQRPRRWLSCSVPCPRSPRTLGAPCRPAPGRPADVAGTGRHLLHVVDVGPSSVDGFLVRDLGFLDDSVYGDLQGDVQPRFVGALAEGFVDPGHQLRDPPRKHGYEGAYFATQTLAVGRCFAEGR